MSWTLRLARQAEKRLEKIPAKDRGRILSALQQMCANPFSGDLVKLKNERATWRRRVGNYRIFFDAYPEQLLVDIVEITRRTSSTY